MFGENDDEVALDTMRKEPFHIRAVGDRARSVCKRLRNSSGTSCRQKISKSLSEMKVNARLSSRLRNNIFHEYTFIFFAHTLRHAPEFFPNESAELKRDERGRVSPAGVPLPRRISSLVLGSSSIFHTTSSASSRSLGATFVEAPSRGTIWSASRTRSGSDTSAAPRRMKRCEPKACGSPIRCGDTEQVAIIFTRQSRGDERAGFLSRFYDEHCVRKSDHNAVAFREEVNVRVSSGAYSERNPPPAF